jgi:tRNA(Ile)-lysidine synthase
LTINEAKMEEEEELFKIVHTTIVQYSLIETDERVLLGVSGGPDSMFMLYALNYLREKLHFSMGVATFNHKLRKEADEEAQFVESVAHKLGAPFFYGKKDVKQIAETEKLSLEEAARKERLKFLFEVKEKNKFDKIALAHNKDDLVETVLYHLIKGSGIEGLVGIKPMSFSGIIHPILFIEKAPIEKFLKEHHITYKTDFTNLAIDYARNRIRHQIMPLITAINKSFKNNIVSMSNILREEDGFIKDIVKKDIEVISLTEKEKTYYSLPLFLSLPLFEKRRIIKELLGRENATFSRIERIIQFLQSNRKKENFFGNLFIKKNKDRFFIEEEKEIPFTTEKEYPLDISSEIFLKEANLKIITSVTRAKELNLNNMRAAFDLENTPLPLKIRFRRAGDRIILENGTKKLQDLFVDAKIPEEKRATVPILVDAKDEILWVIGIRRSALYKISKKTETILLVEAKVNKS